MNPFKSHVKRMSGDLTTKENVMKFNETFNTRIQENWKSPSKIEEKVKLYEGNTSEILDLINQIEDTLESVGLVFHNPMITQLVNYLTNSDIPNIPTAGLAIIQFNKECWSEIEVETGNLLDFAVPKELKIN